MSLLVPPMSDLAVALLGQFRLTNRGELVTGLEGARLQSFFAYLLLHRTAPTLRQQLAFQYWPDATESQALNNLRSLIHKLRHSLPDAESYLAADTLTVWLRPDAPIVLDVEDFEAATGENASREDLERAARLYAGDLLPACYDDWILPRRNTLNERACAALARLVDMLERSLEYSPAINYANQLLRLDPLQETTYRTLMRLHARNGDRAAALRVFHVCVTTLRQELDVLPSKATHAQYERLLAEYPGEFAANQTTGNTASRLPLIGRQFEWRALLGAWRVAAGAKPSCVAVVGEAGIGKSRLVEELTSAVSRQGYAAAVAHCYAAEGTAAYAPVIEWLQCHAVAPRFREAAPTVLAEVSRLLPELLRAHPDLPQPTPLTAGWQRQHLFDALSQLLLRRDHPLLLVIEDAQWCDSSTLEWLHFLLRRDEQAALLVVMTARSEDLYGDQRLHKLLQALRQAGQLQEIRLEPLGEQEAVRLAQEASGGVLSPADAARVVQESEGYPLFTVELARLLPAQDRSASFPAQTAQAGQTGTALPPRMNAILQSRLAQLSPPAREVVALAAVIGRQFTFGVLAAAFGQGEEVLVNNLDELWQRKIVRERGEDAYDFTHGKLREVAYAGLSAARRRSLHRRVAQALAPVPATYHPSRAGIAATHYELAGEFAAAAACYRRAAEAAAAMFANDDAIRLYQRAISLQQGQAVGDQKRDELCTLYERLARILHLLTRYDEARIAYEQALGYVAAGDRTTRANLLRATGNTWREQYQYDKALDRYQEALAGLERLPPNHSVRTTENSADGQPLSIWQEWIQIQLDRSLVYYWLNQVDAMDAIEGELEAAVERYGTTSQRAIYWQRKGNIAFRRNHSVATDDILRWHQSSLDALRQGGDSAALPAVNFGMGFYLVCAGRAQEAVEWLNAALAPARQTGDLSLQARCLTYLAIAYRRLEMPEQVQESVEQCLAVAGAAHMPEYVGTARANAAWLAWRAGEWAAAKRHAQAAFAAWGQLPPHHASLPFQWTCLLPLIAMAHQSGEMEKAIAYTRRLLDPLQQRLPDDMAAAGEQAVQAWEVRDAAVAGRQLELLIELAHARRYL
jgi:DNA-binding SARP family transcriptional activator/tetratricopeptide (TPR) repeat protein